MSALYLLGLIFAWSFLTWLIYRIWQLPIFKPLDGRRSMIHAAAGILIFSVWLGWSFWEVFGRVGYWDSKVYALCERDGGVYVARTVGVNKDKLNRWGQPNFYKRMQGNGALGKEYFFKSKTIYLRKEKPKIIRFEYEVYKRDGMSLLGRSVSYARVGGGLSGPWHLSSYACPDDAGDIDLLKKIFILRDEGDD